MSVDESSFEIDGPRLFTPRRFGDSRGWFSETFRASWLPDETFVQDNASLSTACHTLRGLHYQSPPHAQGKLVRCTAGRVLDVAVDARVGSATYGQHVTAELSAANGAQLWVPAGFLHGFLTLADDTQVAYKCTAYYSGAHDGAVAWDSVGVDWGVSAPALSDRDAAAPAFADWTSPFGDAS